MLGPRHVQLIPVDHDPFVALAGQRRDVPISPVVYTGKPPFRIDNPIRTYHGSPHDFAPEPDAPHGRFRDDKIGSGEGHQVFSRGHYSAEEERVGEIYRDMQIKPPYSLAGPGGEKIVDAHTRPILGMAVQNKLVLEHGVNADPQMLNSITQRWAMDKPVTPEMLVQDSYGYQKSDPGWGDWYDRRYPERIAAATELVDKTKPLLDQYKIENAPKGKMYEVNLHASPDDYLHWDKPLSEQPQLQKKLQEVADNLPKPAWYKKPFASLDNYNVVAPESTGRDAYYALSSRLGGDVAASEALKNAGVAGVRYPDAGSRSGAASPTSNYVTFDPRIMEITKKYGMAGLVAAGVTTLASTADAATHTIQPQDREELPAKALQDAPLTPAPVEDRSFLQRAGDAFFGAVVPRVPGVPDKLTQAVTDSAGQLAEGSYGAVSNIGRSVETGQLPTTGEALDTTMMMLGGGAPEGSLSMGFRRGPMTTSSSGVLQRRYGRDMTPIEPEAAAGGDWWSPTGSAPPPARAPVALDPAAPPAAPVAGPLGDYNPSAILAQRQEAIANMAPITKPTQVGGYTIIPATGEGSSWLVMNKGRAIKFDSQAEAVKFALPIPGNSTLRAGSPLTGAAGVVSAQNNPSTDGVPQLTEVNHDPHVFEGIPDAVAKQYPRLGDILRNSTLQHGTPAEGREGSYLEFYPPWEERNPTPGKPTFEFYPRALADKGNLPQYAAADALHHLGSVDPITGLPVDHDWYRMKQDFLQSFTPEQQAMNQRAYEMDKSINPDDRRTPEEHLQQSRGDAWLRGGIFPDINPEWQEEGIFTPEQKAKLEEMKRYLEHPAPEPKAITTPVPKIIPVEHDPFAPEAAPTSTGTAYDNLLSQMDRMTGTGAPGLTGGDEYEGDSGASFTWGADWGQSGEPPDVSQYAPPVNTVSPQW